MSANTNQSDIIVNLESGTTDIAEIIEKSQSIVRIFAPEENVFDTYEELLNNGYTCRVLNFKNFPFSSGWNPLRYIHSEYGVLKATEILFRNSKTPECSKRVRKAAQLLFAALIAFSFDVNGYFEKGSRSRLIRSFDDKRVNPIEVYEIITVVMRFEVCMLDMSDWEELYKGLELIDPSSFAYSLFERYKALAGPELEEEIMIAMDVAGPILAKSALRVVMKDEILLNEIAKEKRALLIIRPYRDSDLVPFYNLAYSQVLDVLSLPECNTTKANRVHFIQSGIHDEFFDHLPQHRVRTPRTKRSR